MRTSPGAVAAALLAATLSLRTRTVLADMTKVQCADANTTAQDLRRDGKLAASREQLLRCTDPSCPGIVRDDCTRRLDELDRAQPTIAFEVKDAAGSDVLSVTVAIDGKPWADSLEGKALPADPGKHTFQFTVPGRAPITRTIVLTEGEKGRRERIVLERTTSAAAPSSAPSPEPPPAPTHPAPAQPAPPPQAPAPPPPASAPSAADSAPLTSITPEPREGSKPAPTSSLKQLGLIAGGAGVVGLGVGAVFGLLSSSAWNQAKSACGGNVNSCTDVGKGVSYHDTAITDATVSTVGFVAGGVLLATGAILFLTAPQGEDRPSVGVVVMPAVVPRGAHLGVTGWF